MERRLIPRLALLPLSACLGAGPAPSAADQARAYAAALEAIAADPRSGAHACTSLGQGALAWDCVTAAAEGLAATDAADAAALCAALPAGLGRDECHFQVAEVSAEPTRCGDAGAFADDCRLHLVSAQLGRLIPRDAAPGSFEDELAGSLSTFGLAADDPRPWSAAYRWVLGRQQPLDRASCDLVTEPDRAEACRHTAVALFHDRLNHARDSGRFPCDGSPLPDSLAFRPDPQLQAALDARRATDLCP